MRGERWKVTVAVRPCSTRLACGMLLTAAQPDGIVTVSLNRARKAGSSQPGNIRRASVGSCVLADDAGVGKRQRMGPRRCRVCQVDCRELLGIVSDYLGDGPAIEEHTV